MSEIEKIQRYIERTNMAQNGRFYMDMAESFELAQQMQNSDKMGLDIISLAFNYGKAKGYRAAKAERRAAV